MFRRLFGDYAEEGTHEERERELNAHHLGGSTLVIWDEGMVPGLLFCLQTVVPIALLWARSPRKSQEALTNSLRLTRWRNQEGKI